MQSNSQISFLTEAAAQYSAALAGSPAVEYLAGRGIDANASATAHLGWTDSPLPGHESYKGRIAIPYMTRAGVVAMKFRALDSPPGGQRYLWPAGQKSHLYNVEAVLSGKDYIAICEGEFDTLVAHHVCGVNAVGIAGVSHWKSYHSRVFRGFQYVFIIGDNDDKENGANPGQDLAAKIMHDIPHARNILLPRGTDISDFVVQFGQQALAPLLGNVVE